MPRGGRVTAVRGDPEHPVNRGATCRKPLRLPDALTAPDRATVPLWRDDRQDRWRAADLAPGHRPPRPDAAGHGGAPRPGRDRLLHLRPAPDRGLLRRQQARQGLPRDQQRRLQLAAVHVQRGGRLHRRARLRRPAARLRRHRPRGLPAGARVQHVGLPPDPVVADPPPAGRGRRPSSSSTRAARRRPRRPTCTSQVRPGADLPLLTAMLGVLDAEDLVDRPFLARHTDGRRGGARGRARVAAGARRRGVRRAGGGDRRGRAARSARPGGRWRCGRWAPTSRRSARSRTAR